MDRVIEKKKWNTKRIMTIAGITGIVLLIAGSIYFTSGKSKLDVDTERITISEIKKGPFEEFIPVNGVVMPLTTIYLDASDGGRVEEKYVEDGAMLKKGDPILKLSNTDLELQLANEETAVYAQQIQMQISHTQIQQATISKLNNMADVDVAFKEAKRVYDVDKDLYAKKAIGSQEMQTATNQYYYQLNRKKLATQILSQDTVSVKQQESQTKEQLSQMRNTLALLRQKVDLLTLRSPVDGQLTNFDAEIGQNKNKGEHLGQLDVLSGFKVRCGVEEHYLSRVFTGLKGWFEFAGKTYHLVIKKVFPSILNAQFQVDMAFVGEVPKGIRKGQTLQVHLSLSDETTALLLPKGGFFQQTGGNWIFKVSDDGKKAYKVDIQVNRQSPDYFELTSGLKEGDKVITSSYETYGDIQELVLKK
ncbi:MAG: efflux RND transporter periplasmic adaptor subunit [Mucilaginibacter sp.]|uniref:efflux RND transporter periplasmic adaptor subunit n=1 Tax=Mucilaginibacter sp. L3T2-6 TaxID=3062491 RepID=UPI00267482D4|nr:efflux RND transporter periplasmic adaptor subunit [Mucilaginibacter sp. L3T2-6]MDO3643985.1 efflux RND transporter periplasmic adaptor subunit [Mucilaginibacter sp. L3T2-6]MDV6216436.1 efflux RND transporter periplasmic adaptor subunit [Mucilaginibacter sp. L3T2-6]